MGWSEKFDKVQKLLPTYELWRCKKKWSAI